MAAVPTIVFFLDLPAQHHGRPHRGRHQRLTCFLLRVYDTPARRAVSSACRMPHLGITPSGESRFHRAHAVRIRADRARVRPDSWWRGAAIYQLYVRSFADGDGDGIGDLAGVRAHLPYLAALGIDAIWFNPWYPSPMADAGLRHLRLPVHRPGLRHARRRRRADRRGARARDQDHHRHRAQPRLRPAPWFTAALAAGPGSAGARAVLVPAGPRRGRRAAAEQLAVDLRRARLDPGDRAGRHRRASGTCTCSRRSSRTSTGTRPTSGGSSRTCCGSGSTAASTASGSTRPRCCARTPPCRTSPATQPPGPAHPYTDRDEVHEVYQAWRAIADDVPRAGC